MQHISIQMEGTGAKWSTAIEECYTWNTPQKPSVPTQDSVGLGNTSQLFKYFMTGFVIATLALLIEIMVWKYFNRTSMKRQTPTGGNETSPQTAVISRVEKRVTRDVFPNPDPQLKVKVISLTRGVRVAPAVVPRIVIKSMERQRVPLGMGTSSTATFNMTSGSLPKSFRNHRISPLGTSAVPQMATEGRGGQRVPLRNKWRHN